MPLVHRTAVLARAAGNKLLGLTQRLPRRATLGFLFLSAAITWAAALTPVKSSFEVSFLDVGQGDAALIVTPSGRQILIDGGPSPEVLLNHLGSELPFWDRSIDLVVLTHPHDDHLAGLVEVMRRYQIERVLEPGMEHDSPAYQSWLRLIREKKVKYTRAVAGQRIELERGAALEVLHPQEEILAAASDLDNNGVVLRLVVGKVSFLFTGDIGEEAEQELLYQGKPVKSTVLKVAHHGSSSSTSPSFLAAVDPQVAVLSVGADSRSGHPHEEVLVGLRRKVGEENIFLTAEHGSITFATDGEKLWVNTEK
jgi:competence protein ComEC